MDNTQNNTFRVFFSWQSERIEVKKAIHRELDVVAKKLYKEGVNLIVDHDTRDRVGTQDINAEVLQKILHCDIFIADVTPVSKILSDTPKPVKTITPPDMIQGKESPRTVNVIVGDTELQIQADNKPVVFAEMKPFIDEQNRTQVPIRALAEMLNCQVIWNQQTQGITIIDVDGTVITVKIGDNKIFTDGRMVEMDTVAKIINNRAYLPLRFVSEALGLNVFWEYAN